MIDGPLRSSPSLACCEPRRTEEALDLCVLDDQTVEQAKGVARIGGVDESQLVETGEVVLDE